MPTEEQTVGLHWSNMTGAGNFRYGQRLTISNRTVTKLSFPLQKNAAPVGDVNFTIRKVSDDSIIALKRWGDASALSAGPLVWREVTLDAPVLVDEEVRIQAEFAGGGGINNVGVGRTTVAQDDVKAGEFHTLRHAAAGIVDDPANDGMYIYTYDLPAGMVGLALGAMAKMVGV